MTKIRNRVSLLAAAALLLALTGCSAEVGQANDSATAAETFTISDAWVKAKPSGMSAAFGTLNNSGDKDITVTSVSTPASKTVELHQTVPDPTTGEMVMKEAKDGFVIPAHGTFQLAPGGNHIMLMDLTGALTAGNETSFTVNFSDGSQTSFTAPVKDSAGANENYSGGGH